MRFLRDVHVLGTVHTFDCNACARGTESFPCGMLRQSLRAGTARPLQRGGHCLPGHVVPGCVRVPGHGQRIHPALRAWTAPPRDRSPRGMFCVSLRAATAVRVILEPAAATTEIAPAKAEWREEHDLNQEDGICTNDEVFRETDQSQFDRAKAVDSLRSGDGRAHQCRPKHHQNADKYRNCVQQCNSIVPQILRGERQAA
mmetsp:Transcript_19980/g.40373  ORF Transcript_19980/g.40373 Transcript_19980/m.40373 type:complete len:200 (-) Transcript_19980:4001-4600(-)